MNAQMASMQSIAQNFDLTALWVILGAIVGLVSAILFVSQVKKRYRIDLPAKVELTPEQHYRRIHGIKE
jgi:hypothetical protein